MAIDKSTRQHYAMQGKIRNYLGKQKMVKAPKKWKSGPDHPDTELAYITKAEKDLILKADLHNSLSKGPNRGPSGIISLNSAGSGYSGPGRESRDSSSTREDRISQQYTPAPKPAPTRSRQESVAREEKAKADKVRADVREQAAQRSREEAAQKAAEQKAAEQEAKSKELGAAFHGSVSPTKAPVTTDTSMVENMIAGPIQGIINQPKSIINPFETEARTAIPTTPTPPVRTRIQNERAEDIRRKALGDIALQTDKSLMDVFTPEKQGVMSTGKNYLGNYAKKAITNFALDKLGLSFLNPFIGIASLLGKDPVGSLIAKMPKGKGTSINFEPPKDRDGDRGQAPKNIIQASVEKFKPTDEQTAQMNEIMRKRMILQGYADKGQLNEQGMNTLAQMNQLINQYQVKPGSIFT